MNWVNRVPIWAWFLFTLFVCYATWNPSDISLWHFVLYGEAYFSAKAVVVILLMIIAMMYAFETWRSLGKIGIAMFAALIAAVLWWTYDHQWLRADNIHKVKYWGPAVLAFFLTIGLQGNRLWRNITGVVPVTGTDHRDTDHSSHHDAAIDTHHHH